MVTQTFCRPSNDHTNLGILLPLRYDRLCVNIPHSFAEKPLKKLVSDKLIRNHTGIINLRHSAMVSVHLSQSILEKNSY